MPGRSFTLLLLEQMVSRAVMVHSWMPREKKMPQFHGVHGSGQPFLGRGSLAGVHPRPGQKCWIYLGKLEDGRHRQKVGCYICY